MTQEDKEILLKDLSMRLPYGICANLPNHHLVSHKYNIYEFNVNNEWTCGILHCAGRKQIYGAKIEDIQPYLRPISSMTEEEEEEYEEVIRDSFDKQLEFYLRNHLDFRGLIPKGLAIEAPKDMYNEIKE